MISSRRIRKRRRIRRKTKKRIAFCKRMHKGALPSLLLALLRLANMLMYMCVRECCVCLDCVHSVMVATALRNGNGNDDEKTDEGKTHNSHCVIDGQHITANDHMRKVYRRERTYFLSRAFSFNTDISFRYYFLLFVRC